MPWTLKVLGVKVANEILMHFRSMRKSSQDVSLSDPIESGAEGAPLELMEVIAEEGDLLEQVSLREQSRRLRKLVDEQLTQQEKQVIRMRYGLDGDTPKRQREIAKITGLSRSYVSRIEKRALEKLRSELEK